MIIQRISQALNRQRRAATPVDSFDWGEMVGVRSSAGVRVSPVDALSVSTVLACVTLIARSLASVPLVLFRRSGASRTPAEDHPLFALLHDLANPVQSSFDVRQTLFADVLLYGNAYAEIDWSEDGYPLAIWPLPPEHVQLYVTSDRRLVYRVTADVFGVDARVRWLPDYRVHHLRGLVTQGLLGVSPLRAANAIGLAIATEQFGAKFFGEGAHPSVVLSHPSKLSPEAMTNLRRSFESQWSGMSNAHRVAVVGEGVKPEAMRIAPNESQFLETRAFQVAEICRIFGVSPGLVGASETQTYASAEQDLIRFRELTLGPWAEAHEKAIARDLLVPDERTKLFARYKLTKLQATDLKARYDTYMTAKQAGILTTNEIREMEDYNPVDGGEDLWMPVNMAPASVVAKQMETDLSAGAGGREAPVNEDPPDDDPSDDDPSDDDPSDERQAAIAYAWTADVQRRLAARIQNDVRQGGAKALRNGGRVALSEWGEEQMHDWRTAGDAMLAPLAAAGGELVVDVGGWVATAYQSAVRELIDGD